MSDVTVGITMGDAAGVGPEIIMKALQDASIRSKCRPVVIGDAKMLRRAETIVQTGLHVHSITHMEEFTDAPHVVNCLDLDLLPLDLPFGVVSPAAGNAAFRYLEKSVDLAMRGEIDAICTAPLNKEALHKAGHRYPGHTEILAALTGTDRYAMMLSSPKLNVIHVTTHIGLIDAVKAITVQRVYDVIRLAYDTMRTAGRDNPRIGVCGINPHAGENGLFGYGEEEGKDPAGSETSAAGAYSGRGTIARRYCFLPGDEGRI